MSSFKFLLVVCLLMTVPACAQPSYAVYRSAECGKWEGKAADDLALYLGPHRKMTALVARDRRLLRLQLTMPEGLTTWRLFAKDPALLARWLAPV